MKDNPDFVKGYQFGFKDGVGSTLGTLIEKVEGMKAAATEGQQWFKIDDLLFLLREQDTCTK